MQVIDAIQELTLNIRVLCDKLSRLFYGVLLYTNRTTYFMTHYKIVCFFVLLVCKPHLMKLYHNLV